MNPAPPRIVIADDHAVVRSGLKLLLESRGLQVVGEAAQGEEAVELALRHRPDLVLMDLTMPPGPHGLEATRELVRRAPGVPVIILTMHDDESLSEALLEAGAVRYLLKQAPEDELLKAILEACRRPIPRSPQELLTAREFEILGLYARGYGNKEIAGMLDISVKTVESHRNHIYLKLALESRADLTAYALRHGLLNAHSS